MKKIFLFLIFGVDTEWFQKLSNFGKVVTIVYMIDLDILEKKMVTGELID